MHNTADYLVSVEGANCHGNARQSADLTVYSLTIWRTKEHGEKTRLSRYPFVSVFRETNGRSSLCATQQMLTIVMKEVSEDGIESNCHWLQGTNYLCTEPYCYYQKIIKIVVLLLSVSAGTYWAVRDCNSKLSDPWWSNGYPPRLKEALGWGVW